MISDPGVVETFAVTAQYRQSVVSLVGTVVDDRYRIIEVLGEGGMGAVYRAEQRQGPHVAIKVLHEELTGQQDQRERFEREARALFGLSHPNILGVHDFGIVNGNPYLVMELLDGKSLDKMVEDGPLPPPLALNLATQILRGLAFAHGQGVLHRDLKTENVFVTQTPEGLVTKLLDFGLVKFVDDDRWGESKKLTVQGSVFGTPAYMPPEQCAGAPATARSDVYSAGVILFELFTGQWPFMEESRMAMFQAHITRPPPSISSTAGISVPPELEAVFQRALAKNPADRFTDAREMLAALEAVPATPTLSTPPSAPALAKPAMVAAAVVLALLLLVGLAYVLFA